MTETSNYKLKKPEITEPYDIGVPNGNADIVDTELKKVSDTASGKLDPTGNGNDLTTDFTEASTRTNLATGEKLSVLFGKIKKFFTDLKTVAFTGNYSDLSGKPSSLPANGGNADTVDGVHFNPGNNLDGGDEDIYLYGFHGGGDNNAKMVHSGRLHTRYSEGANYANSAGNADTVDGKHATDFIPVTASCNRNWNWQGQGGQPTWVWGSSVDPGTNIYVYNPSNFSVNYANSAGSANAVAWGNVSGRPSSLPANGGTSAACSGNAATATNATNHINASGCHVAIQSGAPDGGKLWAW